MRLLRKTIRKWLKSLSQVCIWDYLKFVFDICVSFSFFFSFCTVFNWFVFVWSWLTLLSAVFLCSIRQHTHENTTQDESNSRTLEGKKKTAINTRYKLICNKLRLVLFIVVVNFDHWFRMNTACAHGQFNNTKKSQTRNNRLM